MKVPKFLLSFLPESFSRNMEDLNTILRNLTLEDNLACQIVNGLTINSGSEISVPHSLKSTPKYFIILRQQGNGNIVDGDSAWTDTQVFLKNVGASQAVVTVALLRG